MTATVGFPPPLPRLQGRADSMFGLPVELACEVDWLADEIRSLLDPLRIDWLSETSGDRLTPSSRLHITGSVRAYDQADVLKHVSTTATRMPNARPGMSPAMELYQDEERFWLVDDQWGMLEINLLKKSWRSWVLPYPVLDLQRCAEWAALWPLAQLLSGPELALLPAISIVREGWGAVIFSPFKMEAELEALCGDGFKVTGPRWSCLRASAGEVRMLPFPGDGDACESTRCDAVVMVEPSRRAVSRLEELPQALSLDALYRYWPIVPLHRSRRQISVKLASNARCCEAQLSRQPGDLLKLMNVLHRSSPEKFR